MHGPAHSNIQQKTDGEKIGDQGRASVTEKRKRYPGDGKQADGHPDIKNGVEGNGADNTDGQEQAEPVRRPISDVQSPENDEEVKRKQNGDTD